MPTNGLRFCILVFGLSMLNTGAAYARDHYLSDAQLHKSIAVLPAPPIMGSAEDSADRTVTFQAYATRTAEQAALAKRDEKFGVFSFASVLGPGFNAQQLPATAAFFDEVKKETNRAKNEAKQKWQRERPCPVNSCQWDPEGDAGDWKKRDYGYPSGHSTRATVFALLLGHLLPQRAAALDRYARELGWRRVVRGVHTPQDVFAGRVLGLELSQDFLASPGIRHDMDAVAHELDAAGFNQKAAAGG